MTKSTFPLGQDHKPFKVSSLYELFPNTCPHCNNEAIVNIEQYGIIFKGLCAHCEQELFPSYELHYVSKAQKFFKLKLVMDENDFIKDLFSSQDPIIKVDTLIK